MKIAGMIKSSMIDFPGKASAVLFLGGCNFRCGYCHNPEIVGGAGSERLGDAGPEAVSGVGSGIEIPALMEFLKKRRRFLDGVCISGGEPTLSEGLYDLIQEIRTLGYAIKLDTNGTNPALLHRLLEDGMLDYAAMDIKGPLSDYGRVTRVSCGTESGRDWISCGAENRLIDAVHESIRLLMGSGIGYEFRTTVCRELLTEEGLRELLEEIRGADRYYLQRFRQQGEILDRDGTYSAYGQAEMEGFLEIAKEYVKIAGVR